MIILNKSKSNLTEGFNEAIYESDLKNDQEINEALKRKSSQLEQIEQKCISKMNEYKIKIEDINKNTKQNQIDSFKNTLDLDLDNLVEYSDYGDDEMYDFKIKPSKNENEENLLIESDDILLNEIDIDKADNIEVEIELDTEKKYIKDTDTNNKVNIYFKKTTEIDIQKQYIDNPIESRNIDVKITTHIDDEIFESFNHKPILPREQIEDEELDVKITHESSFMNKEGEYENIDSNSISINYEMTQEDELVEKPSSVEIRIHLEPKKEDLYSLLELERFERIIPIQNSTEAEFTSNQRKYERKRTEEETTYGYKIQSDEICPTDDEAINFNSNTNNTILIDSIEEIVEGNEDEINKENEIKIDKLLTNLYSKSNELKNSNKEPFYHNDQIIENEINQIEELNRLSSNEKINNYLNENQDLVKTISTNNFFESESQESTRNSFKEFCQYELNHLERENIERHIGIQLIEKETVIRKDYLVEKEINRIEIEKSDKKNISDSKLIFQEEKINIKDIEKTQTDNKKLKVILDNLRIGKNESNEQIKMKQIELKKFELEKLKIENEIRRKELQNMELERSRYNENNLLIENKLKETFDRFSELKEKINNLNEINFCYLNDELDLKNLFLNLEFDLNSLNNEISAIFLEINSLGQNKVDPAVLTQFDLIQSFSSYLSTQLDRKKINFNLLLEKKLRLDELKNNLDNFIQVALKLVSHDTEKQLYVQNIIDLENRIESIRSIEDSIQNCIKQINDLNIDDVSLNKIEIETDVLKHLSMYYVELKKFLNDWKSFESDFIKFNNFLKYELKIESLIYEKNNKQNEINYATIDIDFKKYSLIKEKLNEKLVETNDLLLRGSVLFNKELKTCSRSIHVIVPNACSEYKSITELVNQVKKFLEEKCSRLSFAIKEKEKLKCLEINLNNIIRDLEKISCIETNDLNDKKNKIQNLSEIKREIKSLSEEKETLLNSLNEESYIELKQNINELYIYVCDKSAKLEVDIQNEITRCLPSRVALNDLVEWLKVKINLVENLSKRVGSDDCKSINHLENYKNVLYEITEEIFKSKEACLNFIKKSVEEEIKQGFYDFNITENLATTEKEWNHFKQKVSNDLERLKICLIRISEFDKNVAKMQEWIQLQTSSEINNLVLTSPASTKLSINNLEDDKKILSQINDYKELLSRLEFIWQQERSELIQNEISKISQIVQDHMSNNLDELKSNLQRMELISKLKIESNLSDSKKIFNNETNELNIMLESEINFILNGKIISYQQLDSSNKKMNDCLNKLTEKRNKIKNILQKFEEDLTCNMPSSLNFESLHLSDLKYSSSNISHLEEKAQDLINLLENEILPVWMKYEEIYKTLFKKLTEAYHNTMNDLENIEYTINNSHTNQLFQNRLKEITECKKLNTHFEYYSTSLIEKLCQNESTINHLKHNKITLQDLYDRLSDLAEAFKRSFDEAYSENQIFLNLVNDIIEQSAQANRLIQNFTSIQTITMHSTYSESNNNLLKTFISDFEKCESSIVNTLNKFKSLNIKDIERIEKFRDLTSPCSCLLEQICKYKSDSIEYIKDKNNLIEAKLNEIENFLEIFNKKLSEELKIDLDQDIVVQNSNNRQMISCKSLTKIINCIKFMINNNIELNKYNQFLDEHSLSENKNEIYAKKIKKFKEITKKIKKQVEITTCSNGIYELLIRLNSLNEQLNKELMSGSHIHLFNTDSFNKYLEKFLIIRIDLEKQLIYIQELCLNFIDFRTLKTNILDPIENFYNQQKNDLEILNKSFKKLKSMISQVNNDLAEIEDKLTLNKPDSLLNKIIEKNQLDITSEFQNVETKLNFYRDIKNLLCEIQLKADIEIIQQLGEQLKQKGICLPGEKKRYDFIKLIIKSLKILKFIFLSVLDHEMIRIKYLDLNCSVNTELEKLESEFENWKLLVSKSKLLIDLFKYSHEKLSNITFNFSKQSDDTSILYFENISNATIKDDSNLFNESVLVNSNLYSKIEMSNNKTLNQFIDILKLDLQTKLKENEVNKQEIIHLSKLEILKNSFNLDFINDILVEWNLINEKIQLKLSKLERFKKYLEDLDLKLNKIKENLSEWENQIEKGSIIQMDMNDFQVTLSKKNYLQSISDQWTKKDADAQTLFRLCLNVNKNSLNENKQNQAIVLNLKHRWQNIRLLIKEKIFLIQNIWIQLNDLNDQMENFYLVIVKTDQFYRNTLTTTNNNPKMFLKLIQELYFTIQEDFKLVKYLNDSYNNFSKLASYFSLIKLLNSFKEKFYRINSEWDQLHNEIAVKIKMVSNKNFNLILNI